MAAAIRGIVGGKRPLQMVGSSSASELSPLARRELPWQPTDQPLDVAPAGASSRRVDRAGPLTVERVSEPPPFAALATEWEALHAQISPRTPFTSPLWNGLWWKHYRSRRRLVQDELYLHVVRSARGALVAVAPMMVTERPSFGPVRVRTLSCFGADPNVTELRSLVCRSEDELAVLETLSEHFAREDGRWTWINWGVVRDQNWAGASQRLGAAPPDELVDYQLPLPASWDEFRASRSRNLKESLRKCYNSLKRAGLAAHLRVVEQPEACEAALEVFFRLHAERGRAADTIQHSNVFEQERDRGFLREYVAAAARRDQVRIFQLCVSGEVVATRLGFLLGEELYLYYSGYDPGWGKFSVMTTLVAEAIRWAIESGLALVNLSTGTDVSKLRWRPVAASFRSITQVSPGWSARLAFGAYQQTRRIHRHPRFGRLLALAGRRPEAAHD
jgi:CelD/BcsL family acetyltransferase involved in cellulose biosynthesis